jgi:HNH endonuclease
MSRVSSRFWSKVIKLGEGPNDCWLWTGGTFASGYGRIGVTREDGIRRQERVHRVGFEIQTGETLSEEEQILHHCDTPLCVRVDHLFKGNPQINAQDREDKGRGRQYGKD